jgi:outer membrane protein OmpA-like peptidoglycan-associated protein
MEPQDSNSNQAQPDQQTTPPPLNAATSPAAAPGQYGVPRRSGHKLLWIILGVVGGLVLLMIAFAVYAVMFAPAGRAARASTAFMTAVTRKDAATALRYTSDTSSGARSFIEQAAQASGDSFALLKHAYKSNTYYYLYSLKNSSNKFGRTVVSEANGSWKVTSYVYSASELSLIPGAATSSSVSPATNGGASCLANADYDNLAQETTGHALPASIDYTKANSYYSTNVHFNADTLDYDIPAQATAAITAIANFAKQNAAKQFAINLQGSVATTSAADLNFANQRAQKVQQALEAQGVPASRIILDQPSNIAAYGGTNDSASQQTARDVLLAINDPCTGAAVAAGHTAITSSDR